MRNGLLGGEVVLKKVSVRKQSTEQQGCRTTMLFFSTPYPTDYGASLIPVFKENCAPALQLRILKYYGDDAQEIDQKEENGDFNQLKLEEETLKIKLFKRVQSKIKM